MPPFIPKVLDGHRSLNNFRYRNSILDIEITGYGGAIKSFSIDGVTKKEASVSCRITGRHAIKIVMADVPLAQSKINKTKVSIAPETPVATFSNGKLEWNTVPGVAAYEVIKNGAAIHNTADTSMAITYGDFAEYQLMAIDKAGVSSFASEPVIVTQPKNKITYEVENFAPKASYDYKGYTGSGFVEISKVANRVITIPVSADKSGMYAVAVRYANGNGPVNTENKCAIRTLKVNGKFAGTLVLPQRGKEEWSSWGYSNYIHVGLMAGKNEFTIIFEPEN